MIVSNEIMDVVIDVCKKNSEDISQLNINNNYSDIQLPDVVNLEKIRSLKSKLDDKKVLEYSNDINNKLRDFNKRKMEQIYEQLLKDDGYDVYHNLGYCDIEKFYTKEYLRYKANNISMGYRIHFHFIPTTQNFINARSVFEYFYKDSPNEVERNAWKIIRDIREVEEGSVCEICKNANKINDQVRHLTECHEEWYFDINKKVQRLRRLYVVCSECHAITHINRHKRESPEFQYLLDQYCLLNNINEKKAMEDLEMNMRFRKLLSKYNYDVEIDLVKNYIKFDLNTLIYKLSPMKDRFLKSNSYMDFINNQFSKPNTDTKGGQGKGKSGGTKNKK